jgi:hypothetical protein
VLLYCQNRRERRRERRSDRDTGRDKGGDLPDERTRERRRRRDPKAESGTIMTPSTLLQRPPKSTQSVNTAENSNGSGTMQGQAVIRSASDKVEVNPPVVKPASVEGDPLLQHRRGDSGGASKPARRGRGGKGQKDDSQPDRAEVGLSERHGGRSTSNKSDPNRSIPTSDIRSYGGRRAQAGRSQSREAGQWIPDEHAAGDEDGSSRQQEQRVAARPRHDGRRGRGGRGPHPPVNWSGGRGGGYYPDEYAGDGCNHGGFRGEEIYGEAYSDNYYHDQRSRGFDYAEGSRFHQGFDSEPYPRNLNTEQYDEHYGERYTGYDEGRLQGSHLHPRSLTGNQRGSTRNANVSLLKQEPIEEVITGQIKLRASAKEFVPSFT